MASVARLLLALLCASLLGCAATRTELAAPASADAILVIGSMDMSEAESMLNRMDIERLAPEPAILENQFARIKEGNAYIFHSEALSPGQYRFLGFGGKAANVGRWYEVKNDARFAYTFPRAGIYYVGSYKIRQTLPDGIIGRVAYQIVQAAHPTEREILLQLQPLAQHPYWRTLIEQRLRELPD